MNAEFRVASLRLYMFVIETDCKERRLGVPGKRKLAKVGQA